MALPDLHGELWAWVQGLPQWQSDLLRRLATLDAVRESDLADATNMLLGAFGASEKGTAATPPTPIPALGNSTASPPTKILALRDLVAVGSTPTGQSLQFAQQGITVVYGENGSGKSSYARVLRKACRACAKPVEILPNVLRSGAGMNQTRAGTAQIDIRKGDVEAIIERDVNALPEADLAQISFFDSDCASVYADDESEVTYIPSSLRLLERLVSFQVQLKRKVDEEIARIDARQVPLDGFNLNTKAGALVSRLNENVNPATIAALAKISDEEREHLNALRERVKTAIANDPLKVAAELERKATGAERLAAMVDTLADGLSASVVSNLLTLNKAIEKLAGQSKNLSRALNETSTHAVGGTSWKALWQAAHAYFTDIDEAFPPEEAPGASCPLCHQELSSTAISRLQRFEEFFRGEVERQLRETQQTRNAAVNSITALSNTEGQLSSQSSLILSDQAVLEASVTAFLEAAAHRRTAILNSATASEIQAPALPRSPSDEIRQWVAELRQKAAEQKALAAPDALAKAKGEISELENRLLLAERQTAVLERIETLIRIAKLKKASAALATTGLSRRIGDLTESAVTGQLRTRLLKEVTDASLEHLPIQMGARAPKGKTRVSIELETTRDVEVRDVLSEGERRAVAIAFFLAEVAILEDGEGIVLDDPVSSLDHARRSYVARRLVEEAAGRQVIVFTHDIVFLLELQALAKDATIDCEMRVVRRVGNDAGIAINSLPWDAQNVSGRIGHLKNELQKLGALERKGDPDDYRVHAKIWFGLLRETWERVVEEKLFNGVVGRFQPAIKTLSLKSVLVTPERTAAVEKGMTQASKWMHDQAPALNRPPPKAAELKTALDELEAFVGQFSGKSKQPPTA